MEGLIYEDANGTAAFIQADAIIKISKNRSGGYKVWFAKGYTNSDAELSKNELELRPYSDFVAICSNM